MTNSGRPSKTWLAAPSTFTDFFRQRKMKIFLHGVGVAELVLGVLIMILNVIFIYDGMNSGWYHDPQEEGSQLKVVSIGEGIIAGDHGRE